MSCRFCELASTARRFGTVAAFEDGYPVAEGHMLVVPLSHRSDFFALTPQEFADTCTAILALVSSRGGIAPDGYNIGWNVSEAGGQTVPHAHCHLIPRRIGDVDDAFGGIRGVIPHRRLYTRSNRPVSVPPGIVANHG